MKKVLTLIIAVLATISASAQFEQGKTYIGASLSGLDLSYNGINEAKFGINAQAGLFAADNLLAYAQAGFNHPGKEQSSALAWAVVITSRRTASSSVPMPSMFTRKATTTSCLA